MAVARCKHRAVSVIHGINLQFRALGGLFIGKNNDAYIFLIYILYLLAKKGKFILAGYIIKRCAFNGGCKIMHP